MGAADGAAAPVHHHQRDLSRLLSVRNFSRLLTASAAPLMIAIGVTFIIIMGSIDLSIEGIMAFCGSMLAIIMVKLGGFSELGYLAIPAAILFRPPAGSLMV